MKKNHEIRAQKVLLIDENGKSLGVKDIRIAMTLAKEAGLDLVEVGPNADPVVCKIIDYSKYVYEQKKKLKKKKAGKVKQLKEIRFSPVIEEHDLDIKVNKGLKFLEKGHNLRITIQRTRRQTQEQANEVMQKLLTKFANYSTIEPEPKKEGRRIIVTFKANGKK